MKDHRGVSDGAHCVISRIIDTDNTDTTNPDLAYDNTGHILGALETGCMVHCVIVPCPQWGEPAVATPIHADLRPGRDVALAFWHSRTHQQRPLVIHIDFGTEREHVLEYNSDRTDCWCGPEVLSARRCPCRDN